MQHAPGRQSTRHGTGPQAVHFGCAAQHSTACNAHLACGAPGAVPPLQLSIVEAQQGALGALLGQGRLEGGLGGCHLVLPLAVLICKG